MSERKADLQNNSSWIIKILLALLPLVILGLLLWGFVLLNPLKSLTGNVPPVEQISFERVVLGDAGITLHIRNSGPDQVTIAQVLVDEAYWSFQIEPSSEISRLATAKIVIPYPWAEGEAHEIVLLSSNGVAFSKEIEVALATPEPDLNYWLIFAVIGFYVGIVPVGLGLLWLPVLKRFSRAGLDFALALTVGLLVFLLIDTVLEGIEIAEGVPDVFQAVPLIFFAGLLSFLALVAISSRKGAQDRSSSSGRLWLATSIALGIGLHNLGEGMAIGAAIALGEVALGAFLVIGFTLHNITEGIGIGAPIARDQPKLIRLVGLALLAGGPAILGTWLGGFAFNPVMAVLFLAIGAGAILQVVYEVTKLLMARAAGEQQSVFSWANVAGLTAGIAVMYLTALLVKF